jgi:hypothetical protein
MAAAITPAKSLMLLRVQIRVLESFTIEKIRATEQQYIQGFEHVLSRGLYCAMATVSSKRLTLQDWSPGQMPTMW